MTAATRYINLYLVERRYGGPEEGGWYYDHNECVRSVPYTEEALALARAEADRENLGRRPLHSVLSTGLYFVKIEDEPGQTRPAVTPEYA